MSSLRQQHSEEEACNFRVAKKLAFDLENLEYDTNTNAEVLERNLGQDFEKSDSYEYGASSSGETQVLGDKEGNLTRAEDTALRSLRQKLEKEEGIDPIELERISQADLLRFLQVNFLDVKATSKSFADYLRWRVHFCVDKLQVADVINELEGGVLSLGGGPDRGGLSFLILTLRHCRPHLTNLNAFARAATFLIQQALRSSPNGCGVVVDLTSSRAEQCDVRLLRLLLDLFHHRYPHLLSYLLFCHPPPFFPHLWDALCPYTQPWILTKVHVLGAESCYSRLVEYIAPEYIPSTLGGQLESPHDVLMQQVHTWGIEENQWKNTSTENEPTLSLSPSLSDLTSFQALASSTIVIKEGIMIKQGGKVKTWKKRCFILTTHGHLYYFKNSKSTEPKGVINLNNRCRAGVDVDGREKFFVLETPKRRWHFSCKDSTEKYEWIQTLNTVIAKLSYGNTLDTPSLNFDHSTHI